MEIERKSSTKNRQQGNFYDRYGAWAVVTGASSGIGRELTYRIAERGLNIVLVARRQNVLEQVAADLSAQYGVDTRVVAVDLALETAVERIATETSDLDVGLLVASAGFGTSGPFLEGDLDQEIAMLNVNCRALLVLSHLFGQRLAQRGRGGIILLSSVLGFQGAPYAAHYAATKAYVQTLAEALSVELAPLGVDVLASAPGPVHTGFAAQAGQQMGTALKPADVALSTLTALGRRTTVLPGFLSKLIRYSVAMLPRWAQVRVMGRVMIGMTKHRHGNALS